MTIINTSIGVLGVLIGVLGTLIGLAGLIVSSISLHRVGTIQQVVEYNETVDKYNKNRSKIQKMVIDFREKFLKIINQSENEHKQIVGYDNALFNEFGSIRRSLKDYQSIDEVKNILEECEPIAKLLAQYGINKSEQELIRIKLDNIQIMLGKKGVIKDGK